MLPLQFFAQNFHFALSLFAALVSFATVWLYFDAWSVRKERKELFKWLGFLLLAIGFTVHATFVEQTSARTSLLGGSVDVLSALLRFLGYLTISYGIIIDPPAVVPKLAGLEATKKQAQKHGAFLASLSLPLRALLPLAALSTAFLYFRRATASLERHLKPVAQAFFFFFLFEAIALTSLLRGSENVLVFNLVTPFGPVWMVEHLMLLLGVAKLGRWIWGYLIKRIQTQLYMIFTLSTLVIFLVTTVSFTFLLMRNVEENTLGTLENAAKVLQFAIDGKKGETLSIAEGLAQNTDLVTAAAAKDHGRLVTLTSDFLNTRKISSLVVTSEEGQVLLRAEDPDRWGESLSEDPLVTEAAIGQSASSVEAKEDVLAPLVAIKSAAALRDNAKTIVGVVVVGVVLDNSFVDNIKNATGLDSAVYAGNVRSATTIVAPDQKSRWIGVKEEDREVKATVLSEGQTFKGTLTILGIPYLAVFTPLNDVDNSNVGMVFVGTPYTLLLETASRSIELTFLVTVILFLLAIWPAYRISRYIAYQSS